MKNSGVAASPVFRSFHERQLWNIGDMNLIVTAVGKNLVHYKRYKTRPDGVPTLLISKAGLQKYLSTSEAVLVSESPPSGHQG